MKLAHINLPKEAEYLAQELSSILKEEVIIEGAESIKEQERALFLVPEELYLFDKDCDEDEDWAFGYAEGKHAFVSVLRLHARTQKQYRQRLLAIALHEIGHTFSPSPDHYQTAYWVNAEGHQQWLGQHCTNPRCIMYEVVDLFSPKKNEGYLKLGKEKRYDAGLDDLIERRYKKWFCKECQESWK